MSGSDQTNPPSADGEEEKPKTDAIDDAPEIIHNPYFTNAAKTSVRKLPPWLDHFNPKDLKKLFRCCLAVWIMTILILIHPTLKVLGQAAFLGCIVLFIAPPSGIVFFHLISAVMVLLGMTSAWAWGVISMKAALATRAGAQTKARYGELLQLAQNATNPTQFVKVEIYNGWMLDARVSLTYFFMIGLYLYMVARLRVRAPKLMLLQIMACIVSTIFLTQAPLLPAFRGIIGKILVLPCAIAEGIAIVCNIFIFPTSSATEALDGMRNLLAPMPTFLDACLLGLKHPTLDMSADVLNGARMKILTTYKQLDPITRFLPIDFSIGRWSADDLGTLNDPFRQLIVVFTSLVEVHRQKEVRKGKAKQALEIAQAVEDGVDTRETGRHQINRAVDYHVKSSHPERAELVRNSLKALSSPAEVMVEACKESIEAVSEGLLHSNAFKAAGHAERLQKHTATLEKLRECREEFINSTAQYLFDPSHHIFDDKGILQVDDGSAPVLTGLMLGLLIKERLSQLADALEEILSRIIELETARSRLRIWLPTRLMSLFGWMGTTDLSENDTPGADIGDTVITRISTVASNARLPKEWVDPNAKSAQAELAAMKTPNSRKRSGRGHFVLNTTRWLGSAEGIYGLRMVIVSLALSIPAIIPSTAGFFYREKGMWAVIMAQLALVPYTADLVYGIIVRAVGTVVGGIVGMAAWYIGAGNGRGNPYGEAAIMAVVIVIFMWWRLFSSPALMPAGLMMAVTAYLVQAYSWIDTHNPIYGNPGVGYEVFWRRVVLVFVGFGGTVVVNFLPKPPSANRHYRHLLADSLVSVRDLYALFASNWKDAAPDLREVVEAEGLAVAEVLLSIAGPIKLTMFEFSSSNFDSDTLSKVCQLCMLLNQNVTQLLLYTARLTEEQRAWIIPSTGTIKEGFIAELMAVLSLVQQALKTGDPLPAVLPTPLFAKAVEAAREHFHEGIRGASGVYHKDNFDDEGSRRYAVVLNALLQMLAALDELVLVLKKAVGETSNIAFLETV